MVETLFSTMFMIKNLKHYAIVLIILLGLSPLVCLAFTLATPGVDQTVKNWVNQQMQVIETLSKGHAPYLSIKLQPAQVIYYQALQKRLAQKHPRELGRPIISISVSTTTENNTQINLALLGGTGPLADADLLRRLIQGLNSQQEFSWQNTSIKLLSNSASPQCLRLVLRHSLLPHVDVVW